ncbi:MAG: hypothetical protein L3J39_17395 [Verrucomicrobiales bacterium]|nr:hypothetical protein [Verrucomicrobiales bacterium]
MRAFILIVLVFLFIGAPVIGYQYYLQGMRSQAKGLGVGSQQISDSYKTDLEQLKRAQTGAPGAAANAQTAKRAEQLMQKMINDQKKAVQQ